MINNVLLLVKETNTLLSYLKVKSISSLRLRITKLNSCSKNAIHNASDCAYSAGIFSNLDFNTGTAKFQIITAESLGILVIRKLIMLC